MALPTVLLLACGALADSAGPLSNDRHRVAPPLHTESLDHQSLDLARLTQRGPVLLDFWATWCKPCLAALPELEALHQRYHRRGFTVIGISIDGPRNFAHVRPFVERLGLTFPVALDEDGQLADRYQVRAAPTTFLIDRDGAIVWARVGYERGELQALAPRIETMLPATPDSSLRDSSIGSPSRP